MRKIVLISILLIIVNINVFSYSFGGGIFLGSPTGLRFKLNISHYNSINGTFAWSYISNQLYMGFDYNYLFHRTLKGENNTIPVYLFSGIGLRYLIASSSKDTKFGVKFNLGGGYTFREIPIDISAEISPILDFYPATQLDFNGGIGITFFFL